MSSVPRSVTGSLQMNDFLNEVEAEVIKQGVSLMWLSKHLMETVLVVCLIKNVSERRAKQLLAVGRRAV